MDEINRTHPFIVTADLLMTTGESSSLTGGTMVIEASDELGAQTRFIELYETRNDVYTVEVKDLKVERQDEQDYTVVGDIKLVFKRGVKPQIHIKQGHKLTIKATNPEHAIEIFKNMYTIEKDLFSILVVDPKVEYDKWDDTISIMGKPGHNFYKVVNLAKAYILKLIM